MQWSIDWYKPCRRCEQVGKRTEHKMLDDLYDIQSIVVEIKCDQCGLPFAQFLYLLEKGRKNNI